MQLKGALEPVGFDPMRGIASRYDHKMAGGVRQHADHINPVEKGHLHIEQQHIGPAGQDVGYGLERILELADDLDLIINGPDHLLE